MATREEVQKLAALARLTLPDKEIETFAREFDAILAYVGQLEGLTLPKAAADHTPPLRNVFRPEGETMESGTYTEKIVAQFPEHKDSYLAVKQIISHD